VSCRPFSFDTFSIFDNNVFIMEYLKVRNFLTLLVFALVLGFVRTALAKNNFAVAPTRVFIDLSKPKTESFILLNNGDETIRIETTPIYFPVDSKEMNNGKAINPKTAVNDDLSSYIRVSPRLISIQPGEQRAVRISVRPPEGLKEGEYRAHILFHMVEVAQTINQKLNAQNKSIGMQLSFKLETAVSVIGKIGNGPPKINSDCSINKNVKMTIEVANTAPWRFDGWLRIYKKNNEDTPLQNEKLFLLRESSRQLTYSWDFLKETNEVVLKWFNNDETNEILKTECILK
jgi:hypothetical protein